MFILELCFGLLGFFIGFFFTMLLINFDRKWKSLLETLISIGGTGFGIYIFCNFFEITGQTQKFYSTISIIIGFFISFILFLSITCHLIKDKSDADILRIRDILLGQKAYIEKYYEGRRKEIDERLGIDKLIEREKDILRKESAIEAEKKYLENERNKIDELGNKKLKFDLPENKKILLTKEFVELMPSYIADLSKCIYDIKNHTDTFIDKENVKLNDLKSYFISISLYSTRFVRRKSK